MRTILLTTATLLMLGTTGAFAGGWNMTGSDTAGIFQLKLVPHWVHHSYQNATIDQTHTSNSFAVIGQAGYDQSANIDQGDHHNSTKYDAAAILQGGDHQYANIDQDGSHDGAAVVQLGSDQTAKITQNSSGDTAVIVQVGSGQNASIKQ